MWGFFLELHTAHLSGLSLLPLLFSRLRIFSTPFFSLLKRVHLTGSTNHGLHRFLTYALLFVFFFWKILFLWADLAPKIKLRFIQLEKSCKQGLNNVTSTECRPQMGSAIIFAEKLVQENIQVFQLNQNWLHRNPIIIKSTHCGFFMVITEQ